MKLPTDIDPEVVALCRAMNRLPDIVTTESCSGHGEHPYRIWFRPESENALLPLLYHLDSCHIGYVGWRCEIYTDCAMSHVTYMVQGPVDGHREADDIATRINVYIDNELEGT